MYLFFVYIKMYEFLEDEPYHDTYDNEIVGGKVIDIYNTVQKREYYSLYTEDNPNIELPKGFINFVNIFESDLGTLKLEGYQIFVRDIFAPHTDHKRLLLYHNTGSGKTVTMLSLAKAFIRYFKILYTKPQVTIVGFTEHTIIKELLNRPEFGYITPEEKKENDRLEYSNIPQDKETLKKRLRVFKRRITSAKSGKGDFRFYGYQEFSNNLINVTSKGELSGITLNYVYDDDALFVSRVNELLEKGFITINTDLLKSLKFGLFVCDEIHNVYNMRAKNNRGIAIKYALDYLEKEDPVSSPRCLFMSATPLSGSPTEIIDLMNILIPSANFTKEEYFDEEELRPGMLQKISEQCVGYISFLKDTVAKSYPRKHMRGELIDEIPYLSFIKCVMSKSHEAIVQKVFRNNIVPVQSSSIVDCIFPNPSCTVKSIKSDSCTEMVQSMAEAKTAIESANKTWLAEIGIRNKDDILSGEFLHVSNLRNYSSKYFNLITDILSILKRGEPGKILIYHKYVSGTGILFINEILTQNGILDMTSEAISTTLCSICGIQLSKHTSTADHVFTPCRCLTIYGESQIDNEVTLNAFEARDNIYGNKYKIMLGSKLVQESVNFKGLRHLMILSVPNDISSLVQIMGRAVRHKSHLQLPEELRDVSISIYIHFSPNLESPECYHYRKKMNAYLAIQQIERELRKYAVDCFINYAKIMDKKTKSLDGLPYDPVVSFDKSIKSDFTKIVNVPDKINFSFFAYGFSDREVDTIIILIKKLFIIRPVWSYKDLLHSVRYPHNIIAPQYVTKYFLEDNFKIALQLLIDPAFVRYDKALLPNDYRTLFIQMGNNTRRIIKTGNYFVLVPVDATGCPILDNDIFMKSFSYKPIHRISLSSKIMEKYSEEKIEVLVKMFNSSYDKTNMDQSLVKVPAKTHFRMIRYLIMKTIKLDHLLETYIKFNIVLRPSQFIQGTISTKSNDPVAYIHNDSVHIFINEEWKQITTSALTLPTREENKIIIGQITTHNDEVVFKLKPPGVARETVSDMRKIFRGAVCETFSIEYKFDVAIKLGIMKTIDDKIDKKNICTLILNNLFDREKESRVSGTGYRWLYLFNETPK